MTPLVIVEIVSAVYLGILLITQMAERGGSRSGRLLNVCILLVLLTLVVDAMAYIFMDDSTPFAFRYLVCLLAYLGEGICFLGFAHYSEAFFAERTKVNPWVFHILKIAEVVWIIATMAAFIAGKIVIFENGIEVDDNGYPLYLSVYQIVIMLYTPIVALRYRRKLGNEAVVLLSFFNITPIAGILAAIFAYYDYSYVLGALALVFISEFLQRRKMREQQEEYQEQLREALRAAEAANRSKSDFLFSMSHDIRTPMNAIQGFTNMAERHIDNKEKVLDCLHKTQDAGGILLSLINGVLEVSRIESGNAVLEEQSGDVLASFANIEGTMLELAKAKDIDLAFEFGEIANRFVYADFGRCMRVLVNVISNAIKYTPEGGRVRVRCEQVGVAADGCATFRYIIADNGIGMSEEFQKHVFEQFSRESTSTVSGIQGTGLGLTVCKSFVDLMGGTIECQSEQGAGTTFIITLPFRLQEGESYIDPETGKVVSVEGVEAPALRRDFSGARALLVEDNELNREIALDILKEAGLEADDAEDGEVAVEMLRQKGPSHYDVVLMDIQMPVMDGYAATRAIRAMYPEACIPIIALSANAFEEDRARSREAGMDDHVAKPIDINELLISLANFIH